MFPSLLSSHTSQFLLLVGLERVPSVLSVPLGAGGRAGRTDGTAEAGGGGAGTALARL